MAPNQEQPRPDSLISKEAARNYWENASADIHGMLGGIPSLFGPISRVDLQGSKTFLARLGIGSRLGRSKLENCVEGGAGIGRVTQGLLGNIAENIDIVEPIAKFTDALQGKPGVRSIFNVGVEEWEPTEGIEYDLIWTQWCLGHLTDEQVITYLGTCKACLRPETGIMVIKENLSTGDQDAFDPVDSCVTRRDTTWKALFQQAGLTLIKDEPQRGLPETGKARLLPVHMYALKP